MVIGGERVRLGHHTQHRHTANMGKSSQKPSGKAKPAKDVKKTNDKTSTKPTHKASVTGLFKDAATLRESCKTDAYDASAAPEAGYWVNVLFPSYKAHGLAMQGKSEKQRGKNDVKAGSWSAEWAGTAPTSAVTGKKLSKSEPKICAAKADANGTVNWIVTVVGLYHVPVLSWLAGALAAAAAGVALTNIVLQNTTQPLPRDDAVWLM